MKVSILMFTARDDCPMVGYPNIHMFEYLMASLRKQTYKNFEVVIADVIHDRRPNYFKEHPEKFDVIHIPVKPNVWTPKGYIAISTTKNTCLLHATGDVVIFVGDCTSLEPTLIEVGLKKLEKVDYVYTAYESRLGDTFRGYMINPHHPISHGHSGLTAKIELLEELNGYDEKYDGARGYEDCDIAIRLAAKGTTVDFNTLLMRHQIHKDFPTIKNYLRCSYPWHNYRTKTIRQQKSFRVNDKITDEEFNILADKCAFVDEKKKCITFSKVTGKEIICPHNGNIDKRNDENFKDVYLYKNPSLTFDLKEQRKNVDETLKELKKLVEE